MTYRTSTDTGYGQLATLVAEASNQTGSQLAQLMRRAAALPNGQVPQTARAQIQQGLDQAVDSTADQASQGRELVPPYPTGSVSAQFTQVMDERAQATSALRTTIDRLLGMPPLPIAGAPTSVHALRPRPPCSTVTQAAAAMGAAGLRFERADAATATCSPMCADQHLPVHLPALGVGAGPDRSAPLGSDPAGRHRVGAGQLPGVGPVPPAGHHRGGSRPPRRWPPGARASSATAAAIPVSAVPGPAPTVLPPTGTVSVAMTVTNCGTVHRVRGGGEPDPHPRRSGRHAPPPPAAPGGTSPRQGDAGVGSVRRPHPAPAGGRRWPSLLTSTWPSPSRRQANPAGSSQQFLIQITG